MMAGIIQRFYRQSDVQTLSVPYGVTGSLPQMEGSRETKPWLWPSIASLL